MNEQPAPTPKRPVPQRLRVERIEESRAVLYADGMKVMPDRALALTDVGATYFDYGTEGEERRLLALAILMEALSNPELALATHRQFAEQHLGYDTRHEAELTFNRVDLKIWAARVAGWGGPQ